ncbi:inhibitor of growth protein 3 isoform X1 [Halyomorpha halys]|uniref:inhibitor of growth protein 3 isoform X1 n=2 Tax=Halyomorpha halys TaxID=286706 RepID=UPI0006D5162A|nr:inhibitor of growth protein 3 isoform X1 [Halyomorpha halys]
MLYLEDYLEMIEHLPQELRDRFTEMRELDLQVQNSMDSLEKRVKFFFSNAKRMKPAEKEAEYETIRKDYYKTLEDADEKVQLSNQVYDLVARYLRRLDQETHKFKLELEADHSGITEILEKRSHDMDNITSTNSSQKENRYSFAPSQRISHHEKRRDSGSSELKRVNVEKIIPDIRVSSANVTTTVTPAVYSLGHIGAGGSAIAAAASQAIAATQQMQQGRRTASLKASYEAIHSGSGGGTGGGSGSGHGHEISISKELAGAAQTAIAAIQDTHKKHKKKSGILSSVSSGLTATPASSPASIPSPSEPPSVSSDRNSESYDPNEPRYCICNEVAFGTMVACDNKTCPYEWYHYPCVGITDKPKGKWYCPHCTAAMKRRNRKNQ